MILFVIQNSNNFQKYSKIKDLTSKNITSNMELYSVLKFAKIKQQIITIIITKRNKKWNKIKKNTLFVNEHHEINLG